jgi:hypothetical protein
MDQLTVPVLADEHVRPLPRIGERHHQLAAVPKSKNNRVSPLIKHVDRFHAFDAGTQRHPEKPNHSCA